MANPLLGSADAFLDQLVAFDADTYSGEDWAVIVGALSAVGNACEAARGLAAARAAECNAHRSRGYADPDEWLGREAGTSPSRARRGREMATKAKAHPKTEEAMRSGKVSSDQAAEILDTSEAAPESEDEMLALAAAGPLRALKDKGRERRLGAMDADDLHEQQRAARSVRHGLDRLGMVEVTMRLMPHFGVALMKRLGAETMRLARAAGNTESWEALAHDAFMAMVSGDASAPARRASSDVVFVCDLRAYRRGHTHGEEVCHVVGGGPVPLWLVRDQLEADAFLKVVLHDGVEIRTVAHFGRHRSAALRTALALGAPPEFRGAVCGCGCGGDRGMQWDHIDPLAHHGATSYDNLQPLTGPHHRAKTERDRAAGLLDGKRREAKGAQANRGPL